MPNIIEIAEALKTVCATYADAAEVKLYPEKWLGDTESGLFCIVKPNDLTNVIEARSGGSLTYEFEVGFLKWIADESEGQTLLLQVETFIKEIVGTLLLNNQYVVNAVTPNILYSVTAYDRRKQFASILTVGVYDNEYA